MSATGIYNGIDFSQYPSWEKVVTPEGGVYYKVPGTGYVYDPFVSQSKGQPVLFTNPQPKIDEKRKQEKAANKATSVGSQATQIGGTVAGTVGGAYLVHEATKPAMTAAEKLAEEKAKLELARLQGSAAASNTTPVVVDSTPPVGTGQAFTAAATENGGGAVELAGPTQANGSFVSNSGDAVATGPSTFDSLTQTSTLGDVIGAVEAAKGTYDLYNAFKRGGEGQRTAATEIGAGLGSIVGGPLGGAVGAATGNTIGYGLQGKGWKNDTALLLATGAMSAPLVVARHLGFDVFHRSTKQEEQAKTEKLLSASPEDQSWTGMVSAMRGGPAPTGEQKNFDKELAAGNITGKDIWGSYGVLKLFSPNSSKWSGPSWDKLSEGQRAAIADQIASEKILNSKKGDVNITNEDRAIEIANNVLNNRPAGQGPQSQEKQVAIKATPQQIGVQLANRLNARA